MIWKNPFLSKNSEQQFGVGEFLSLFDCTVLQMIEERNLSRVSYVSSTPGAGKTSLFRAFSPQALTTITNMEEKEHYKDIYKHMERLEVIKDDKVMLLSANISCARNYNIIDEMFQNGRRKQIFFALLNYRIAISFIRSIAVVMDIERNEYHRITFAEIPQEMLGEFENLINAADIYEWACNGEKQLCKYLDSERDELFEISFVHMTLLMIKLFEPQNILFDGEECFTSSLMIFDDFHKLSDAQKQYMSEALYTLKCNTGVWLGQRLEGVKNSQLISMDGSLSRDYNPNIVIDNYWPEKQRQFQLMLENIANRRVKEAGINHYISFSDCIKDAIENKKYNKVLKKFVQSIVEKINSNVETKIRYQNIMTAIDEETKNDMFKKAICYECIIIKENRRNDGQLSFFFGEADDANQFMTEFVKTNESSARFYVCFKCNIPFYHGMNNLLMLSSYNIEQFLVFAGAYFDCCRVKLIEGKASKKYLTAEEQTEILKKTVRKQWEDMDLRYSNIREIKSFLNKVAQFCCKSRDSERNSYCGGAYTGFAIKTAELKRIIEQEKYKTLVDVLGVCLSSKYLERKYINNDEECVFYLNRWLCVFYGLPLAYGGWKHVSVNEGLSMCGVNMEDYSNQIELDL